MKQKITVKMSLDVVVADYRGFTIAESECGFDAVNSDGSVLGVDGKFQNTLVGWVTLSLVKQSVDRYHSPPFGVGEYSTRGEDRAVVLMVDKTKRYPLIGYRLDETDSGAWYPTSWLLNGEEDIAGSANDLIRKES